MAENNRAAYLTGKDAPLKVDATPLPEIEPDQVLIKNHALAVNPVDWKIQDGYMLDQFQLPTVLGTDVAGEIVQVGKHVSGFKQGDRVLAHCINLPKPEVKKGAFQLYTAAYAVTTSKIPSSLSFTKAVVLPLAISTAAVGLYAKEHLQLPLPSLTPQPANKIIIIWGGSSSVGAVAIQLAKASGITVVSTASKHNLTAVKEAVGADYVFDHSSSDITDEIVDTIQSSGKEYAGAYDSISLPASFKTLGPILEKLPVKKLATTLPPSDLPGSIDAKFLFAATLVNKDRDVGGAIWDKFVPEALEKGVLKALPEPLVVGKGLESLQKGLDENKKGVSFQKVVVEL